MNDIAALHSKAMAAMDEALLLRLRGDKEGSRKRTIVAFECERKAVSLVQDNTEMEPTRSVLCRSAAAMALDIEEFREAERLISLALIGNPPEPIVSELRELARKVQFHWNLSKSGETLLPNIIDVAIEGDVVGPGIAEATIMIDRQDRFRKMISRTIQRLSNIPFRGSGKPPKEEKTGHVYVGLPQYGSYKMRFVVGSITQPPLPGMDFGGLVVREILDCVHLFSDGEIEKLKERFANENYFSNFIGIARAVAPDGKKVTQVGILGQQEGKMRKEILRTVNKGDLKEEGTIPEEEPDLILQGTLRFADALGKKSVIKLLEKGGKSHKIVVPEGVMSDIVKPLWDQEVLIKAVSKEGIIHLVTIDPLE